MMKVFDFLSACIPAKLFALNGNGNVVMWSSGMEEYTQLNSSSVLGKPWDKNKFLKSFPLAEIIDKQSVQNYHSKVKLDNSISSQEYELSCHRLEEMIICELKSENSKNITEEYFFRDNPLPMWIYDIDSLKILEVNNSAIDQYGWTKDEFLKLTIEDIRPEEDIEKVKESVKVRKAVLSHSGEWKHKSKNGNIFSVEIHSHLTSYNGISACIVMANNIELRKQSELKLSKSEELHRLIVETSQEGIWMIDHDEITNYVNPKIADLLGYAAEEMIGKTLFDFMDDEGKMIANINFERRKKGVNEQHDFKFLKKDGSEFWCMLNTNPILNDGKYIGALSMISDISERKSTESDLRVSEAKYKSLIESSLDAILILTYPDGKINGCNLQAELLFGETEKALKESSFASYLSEKSDEFEMEFKQMLESDTDLFTEDYILKNSEGIRIPVDISMNVIEDGSSKIIQLVMRDITSRKYSEREIRETNRKLETLLSNLHGAAYSATASYPFNMNFLSEGIHNLSGQDSSELIAASGKDFRELIIPEHREKILSYIAEYVKAGEAFQISYKIITADNSHRWILENGKSVWSDTEQQMLLEGYLTDVTYLKEAEENLKKSQDFFKAVLENSFDGVGVFDKDGIVKFQGPTLYKILGYKPEELLGTSIFELIHEEDLPQAVQTLSVLLENPGVSYNLTVNLLNKNGEYVKVQSVMTNLLHNSSINGIIGNYRKVEEKKNATSLTGEDIPLEEPKLRQEFSSNSNLDLEHFQRLRESGKNAPQMIDDVIDFSRSSRKKLIITEVDPIRLVSQIYNDCSNKGSSSLLLSNDYPMKIYADKNQLSWIFLELMNNSLNHNREKKDLLIRAKWVNRTGGPVLEFSDNGKVNEAIDIENIFQPFVVGSNNRTGLGLTKVKRVIERMNGSVSAEINNEMSLKILIKLPFVDYIH